MFNKPIEEMDFKDLRNAFQILYDAYIVQQRKYDDLLENLDRSNFSGIFKEELDGMSTSIRANADGITAVAKDNGDLGEKYTALKITADGIQADLKDTTKRVTTIETDSGELTKTVSDMQGKISANAEGIELNFDKIAEVNKTFGDNLASAKNELSGQISGVDSKVIEFSSSFTQTAEGLQGQVNTVTTRVTNVEGNVQAILDQKFSEKIDNAIETAKKYAEDQDATLQDNISVVSESVTTLRGEYEASAKEFSTMHDAHEQGFATVRGEIATAKDEAVSEAKGYTGSEVVEVNTQFESFKENEFKTTADGLENRATALETSVTTITEKTIPNAVEDAKTELEKKIESSISTATSEFTAKADEISGRVNGCEVMLEGVEGATVVQRITEAVKNAKDYTDELIGELPEEAKTVLELVNIAKDASEAVAKDAAVEAENNAKNYADEVKDIIGIGDLNLAEGETVVAYYDAQFQETKNGLKSYATKTEVTEMKTALDTDISNAQMNAEANAELKAKELAETAEENAKSYADKTAKGLDGRLKTVETNYAEILTQNDRIRMYVEKRTGIANAKEVSSESEMTDEDTIYKICEYGEDGVVTNETYYWCNGGEWIEITGDRLFSVFEQTADGFRLKGDVRLHDDLIIGNPEESAANKRIVFSVNSAGIPASLITSKGIDNATLTISSANIALIGNVNITDGTVDFSGATVTGLGLPLVFS